MQEQGAQLGIARMVVGQEQGFVTRVHAQFVRGMHNGAHAVVVPGLFQANGGFQRADTADLAGFAVFQHEYIALVGAVQLASKGQYRAADAA
jgi:hypothetical protein